MNIEAPVFVKTNLKCFRAKVTTKPKSGPVRMRPHLYEFHPYYDIQS